MYTTLDCDFLETEFFYTSHHSGQGEKDNIDTLSWLKWAPSSEEVNHNTQDNPSQEVDHNTQNESLVSSQSSEPTFSATNQDPPSPLTKVSNSQFNEELNLMLKHMEIFNIMKLILIPLTIMSVL